MQVQLFGSCCKFLFNNNIWYKKAANVSDLFKMFDKNKIEKRVKIAKPLCSFPDLKLHTLYNIEATVLLNRMLRKCFSAGISSCSTDELFPRIPVAYKGSGEPHTSVMVCRWAGLHGKFLTAGGLQGWLL